MQKILSVIKREYLQIVRTKGFIIGTVLGPVLIGAFLVIPVVFSLISVDQQEQIGVVDLSGEVAGGLEEKLDQKMKDGKPRFVLKLYENSKDENIKDLKEEMNQKVLNEEFSAYIFIPEGIIKGGSVEYVSQHVSDFDKIGNIHDAVNSVIIEKRLKKEGLDPQKIAQHMKEVSLKTSKVTQRGVEEDTGGTFIISYLLVFILYMTLFFYGSIILRGVIEEKSSRVVEIVLSSLRPFQLMLGKIMGIAAVGFTQYAIWALFGLGVSQYGSSLISGFFPAASFNFPSIPAYIFIYFVVFFILGYFLYATVYAAIGSLVNSEKEAQQLLLPVSMFLVVPILLMMYVIRSPESTLSVVLSMIPFFAPILMLLRVCVLFPPFPQVAGSILLLILTILAMVWVVAKIYRVGILMYGKRPRFPEIIKWFRYQ